MHKEIPYKEMIPALQDAQKAERIHMSTWAQSLVTDLAVKLKNQPNEDLSLREVTELERIFYHYFS